MMLVGQDRRALGALIVPNLEILEKWVQEQKLDLKLPTPESTPEEVAQSDLQ